MSLKNTRLHHQLYEYLINLVLDNNLKMIMESLLIHMVQSPEK